MMGHGERSLAETVRRQLGDVSGAARQALASVSRNPRLVGRQLNRWYYRATAGAYNAEGVDLFEADWDTLVLLDACRYDLFESVGAHETLPGTLEPRTSRASNTVGFLRANVAGRDLRDTVYVTANPQYRKHEVALDATFHAVVDLWERKWDDEMDTVLPETVTEAALDAVEAYPDKRILVHYNQPHVPFVGQTGREAFDTDAIASHPLPFWQQPMAGVWDVDDEAIWTAYRENLDLVLPHVERLLTHLDGRTVVTADHGNMVNERSFPVPIREYGHPGGVYTHELVTVPWLVHEADERRRVVAEDPVADDRTADETVEDRLEALGYA